MYRKTFECYDGLREEPEAKLRSLSQGMVLQEHI